MLRVLTTIAVLSLASSAFASPAVDSKGHIRWDLTPPVPVAAKVVATPATPTASTPGKTPTKMDAKCCVDAKGHVHPEWTTAYCPVCVMN